MTVFGPPSSAWEALSPRPPPAPPIWFRSSSVETVPRKCSPATWSQPSADSIDSLRPHLGKRDSWTPKKGSHLRRNDDFTTSWCGSCSRSWCGCGSGGGAGQQPIFRCKGKIALHTRSDLPSFPATMFLPAQDTTSAKAVRRTGRTRLTAAGTSTQPLSPVLFLVHQTHLSRGSCLGYLRRAPQSLFTQLGGYVIFSRLIWSMRPPGSRNNLQLCSATGYEALLVFLVIK